MTTTTEKPLPVDFDLDSKEPPLLHIMQFDEHGRPRDHALCGAKISELVRGGTVSCQKCVKIRLGMKTDKGWVDL